MLASPRPRESNQRWGNSIQVSILLRMLASPRHGVGMQAYVIIVVSILLRMLASPRPSLHFHIDPDTLVSILLRMLASPRRQELHGPRRPIPLFQSYSGCLLPHDLTPLGAGRCLATS